MFGLAAMIAPMTVDEFLDDYWGKKSLLVPGNAGTYDGLFGWDDINHLLNHGRIRFPAVRLVLEKESLGAEAMNDLRGWLGKGATLVLNSVQQLDPVVDRFASTLANDLNAPVNVNSYTSWPSKQGFDTHYDKHDVFVVQVEGEKAWRVAEPTRVHPIEGEKGRQEPPEEFEPYLECVLKQGDLLYVPRGHWHYAVSETPCVHLTVGPSPRTGVDFLQWLAQRQGAQDELFRQDLPLPGADALGGGRTAEELANHWTSLRDRLAELLDDDSVYEQFLDHCMQTNRASSSLRLPETVTLRDDFDLDTRLVMAPNQKALVRYREGTESASVVLRGLVINLEKVPPQLLESLLGAEGSFTGNELLASSKAEIAPEGVRVFMLRLFESGVLQLADAED